MTARRFPKHRYYHRLGQVNGKEHINVNCMAEITSNGAISGRRLLIRHVGMTGLHEGLGPTVGAQDTHPCACRVFLPGNYTEHKARIVQTRSNYSNRNVRNSHV